MTAPHDEPIALPDGGDPDPPSWARVRIWWRVPMLTPRAVLMIGVLWPLVFTCVMWWLWDAPVPRPSFFNLLFNLMAIAGPALILISVVAVGLVGIMLSLKFWWHRLQMRAVAYGASVLLARADHYMRTGVNDPLTAAAHDYRAFTLGQTPNASAWRVAALEWIAAHPGALPFVPLAVEREDGAQ